MFNLTFRWIKYLNDRAGQVSGKNYIINGGFDIWQRKGVGANTYTADYPADRFFTTAVDDAGGVNRPFTCQRVSDYSQIYKGFFSRLTFQDTLCNRVFYRYRMEAEDTVALKDKKVTFSFYVGANNLVNAANVGVFVRYANSTDNWSASTALETSPVLLTLPAVTNTALTRLSYTFELTPSGIANGIEIGIGVSRFPVIASPTTTIDIGGMKLEEGEYATNFEQRSVGEELALCQRYYQRLSNTSDKAPLFNGSQFTSASSYSLYNFVTTMRTSPAFLVSSVTDFKVLGNVSEVTATNITASTTPKTAEINTAVALPAGTATFVRFVTGVVDTKFIAFDAEL
jgi:hypothetical protein